MEAQRSRDADNAVVSAEMGSVAELTALRERKARRAAGVCMVERTDGGWFQSAAIRGSDRAPGGGNWVV